MNITDKEYTIATDILNKINAYATTNELLPVEKKWIIDRIAEGLHEYNQSVLKALYNKAERMQLLDSDLKGYAVPIHCISFAIDIVTRFPDSVCISLGSIPGDVLDENT